MSEPHLSCRGLSKRYGATQALAEVDLEVERGSIHALVGENGAGKSTLGKIIAGVVQPDSGSMELSGRPVHFGSPRQALESGVTIIAQELSLVPARSVLENVFLGIESSRGPWVMRHALVRRYADLTESVGIFVDPAATVGRLGVSDQQKVEILRALARKAELIVMDEPTARLSKKETQALAATMRSLSERGTTFVFVSHFLDEVRGLADTITIMRDSRVVRTSPSAAETHDSLIVAMTGRPLDMTFPHKVPPAPDAPVVLDVSGLTSAGRFSDVSFSVRKGEIVALAGLVGAGRSDVAHAIYGAVGVDSGTMRINDADHRPSSPRSGLRAGVALIPESRKDQGLVLDRSVSDNITLPYLREVERFGLISGRAENTVAEERSARAGVKAESVQANVRTLSGGNQQKVLFARTLVRQPVVLVADEPTRGVDVGAKRAIYDLIVDLAAQGMAVLVVSSELEEVLGLAHRVVVMHEGRVVASLDGFAATEESIMQAAFGLSGNEGSSA
jgi:simple sugar transport system ATP-binding protein/ribose transport system ATP-binding protein